mgnify:CR=1 FL=1
MDKAYVKKLYVPTRYGGHLSVFDPDEKKGFIVTVPGLPGVVTWGRNIAHAKKMVREAIELCIECRAEEAVRHTKTRPPRRSTLAPTSPNQGDRTRLPRKAHEFVAA